MSDSPLFARAFELVSRRWRAVSSVVLVLCALSAMGLLGYVEYDGDVLLMLPDRKDISRSIEYFRGADASGKVVLSLSIRDETHGRAELLSAVDSLAAGLDRGIFSEVMTGLEGAGEGIEEFFGALPFLLSDEELTSLVEPRLARDEVASRLRAGYLSMFRPASVMAGRMLMEDPLGLRAIVLQRLSDLSDSLGFDVRVEDGHLMSADGSHALIVASTDIEATDTIGSRRLVDSLEDSLSALPPYVRADVVSGHLHTVSNEETIKADIRLTLAIASAGFVLLFVVFLGDLGAVLVFMVPAVAVLLAANISYAILGRLSYSVIGLAAVVAGISVDYAIHVYIVSRLGAGTEGPPSPSASPALVQAIAGISRPVTLGALTTVGMFASFFSSSIRGYHQMAVFSIISVLCALAISLFMLPHVLLRLCREKSLRRIEALGWLEGRGFSGRASVAIWLVLCLVMAYFALGVRLDTDVRAIDGTRKEILEAEDRFLAAWGSSRLAVLVGRAPDLASARELEDSFIYDGGVFTPDQKRSVSSFAALWPSERRMRANMEAWQGFWSPERVESLRRALREEGARYGYSPEAFDPFFESINNSGPPPSGLPGMKLTERYIRELPHGGWQVSVFFPDEPGAVAGVTERIRGRDDAYVVSGNALGGLISSAVVSDMKRMTLIAGIAIVALAVLFLRSPALIASALVPVVTSTLWLAGGVSMLGLRLNVANLVAFIVVMGLCIDYGIFMAHRSLRTGQQRRAAGTVLAVTLSALSSLIGAGVLIFASHPALFSIGVTLVIGLGSGYLSAVFVSPQVAGLFHDSGHDGGGPAV